MPRCYLLKKAKRHLGIRDWGLLGGEPLQGSSEEIRNSPVSSCTQWISETNSTNGCQQLYSSSSQESAESLQSESSRMEVKTEITNDGGIPIFRILDRTPEETEVAQDLLQLSRSLPPRPKAIPVPVVVQVPAASTTPPTTFTVTAANATNGIPLITPPSTPNHNSSSHLIYGNGNVGSNTVSLQLHQVTGPSARVTISPVPNGCGNGQTNSSSNSTSILRIHPNQITSTNNNGSSRTYTTIEGGLVEIAPGSSGILLDGSSTTYTAGSGHLTQLLPTQPFHSIIHHGHSVSLSPPPEQHHQVVYHHLTTTSSGTSASPHVVPNTNVIMHHGSGSSTLVMRSAENDSSVPLTPSTSEYSSDAENVCPSEEVVEVGNELVVMTDYNDVGGSNNNGSNGSPSSVNNDENSHNESSRIHLQHHGYESPSSVAAPPTTKKSSRRSHKNSSTAATAKIIGNSRCEVLPKSVGGSGSDSNNQKIRISYTYDALLASDGRSKRRNNSISGNSSSNAASASNRSSMNRHHQNLHRQQQRHGTTSASTGPQGKRSSGPEYKKTSTSRHRISSSVSSRRRTSHDSEHNTSVVTSTKNIKSNVLCAGRSSRNNGEERVMTGSRSIPAASDRHRMSTRNQGERRTQNPNRNHGITGSSKDEAHTSDFMSISITKRRMRPRKPSYMDDDDDEDEEEEDDDNERGMENDDDFDDEMMIEVDSIDDSEDYDPLNDEAGMRKPSSSRNKRISTSRNNGINFKSNFDEDEEEDEDIDDMKNDEEEEEDNNSTFSDSRESELTGQSKTRYFCNICHRHYATSSNLSRHKQTHRSLDSQAAKKCPHCPKVYVSMPALAMHILTHNLHHECSFCNKKFSRPWLLQGHMRSHTGEKPYGCAHCGKFFADRSNLRAHMQTHSGSKNYTCKRCNKSFALKSYLNKHHDSACFKEASSPASVSSSGAMELNSQNSDSSLSSSTSSISSSRSFN